METQEYRLVDVTACEDCINWHGSGRGECDDDPAECLQLEPDDE